MTNTVLSVSDLRDLSEPVPVEAWPPAPAMMVVLSLILLGVVLLLWQRFRIYQANAYRRAGLLLLDHLEQGLSGTLDRTAYEEVSAILKRVALVAYPRADVAPLYGEEWLHFLDKTGDTKVFTKGAGQLLARAPEPTIGSLQDLLEQARAWIKQHPKNVER